MLVLCMCGVRMFARLQPTSSLADPIGLQLRLHHFKWRDGCLEKLRERAEQFKKLGLDWWVESDNFVQFYDRYSCSNTQHSTLNHLPCTHA
jgi:hypothetical protein